MRSELSFVIVIATMGICLLMCLWVIHQQFKSNQIQMTEMRQSLSSMTSLVAAKDIQAYAGLEAVRTSSSVTFEQAPAMDDISVAQRMRDTYEAQGIDPDLAMNQDDPLADFGGTHSLI